MKTPFEVKPSICSHLKPYTRSLTTCLTCFVLEQSVYKTKHMRRLVQSLVGGFEWLQILGFSDQRHQACLLLLTIEESGGFLFLLNSQKLAHYSNSIQFSILNETNSNLSHIILSSSSRGNKGLRCKHQSGYARWLKGLNPR